MKQGVKKLLGGSLLSIGTVAAMTVTAFAEEAADAATGLSMSDIVGTISVIVIFAILGYKEVVERKQKKAEEKSL